MRFARQAICGIGIRAIRATAVAAVRGGLGAKVQQATLGAGVADLDRLGIDAALWVGTPGGVDYDDVHRAFDSVAVTLDRPEQMDQVLRERPTPRVWFLEHDGDPVVRFRAAWHTPDRGGWRRPRAGGARICSGGLASPGRRSLSTPCTRPI